MAITPSPCAFSGERGINLCLVSRIGCLLLEQPLEGAWLLGGLTLAAEQLPVSVFREYDCGRLVLAYDVHRSATKRLLDRSHASPIELCDAEDVLGHAEGSRQ